MAGDLNQLVQDALGSLIQSGGLPTAENLYQTQAQSELENTFGRGLGISSVTRDALAKARVDATLAAQQAQLAALGQAAGVAQQELNRGQAGAQFQAQLGLQKKALGQQRDLANQQLLAGGLGLGVGGLAQVAGKTFGPEITGGLRRLFGVGGTPGTATATAQPGLDALGQGQQIVQNAPTDLASRYASLTQANEPQFSLTDLSGGSGGSLPDLSWVGDSGTSFGLDALSGLSGLGNLSGMDFSWLNDPNTTYSLLSL
jgi:hypothetical protein